MNSAARPSRPELLAPAGDWDALRAAVANGADAVYFGLSNFNARHRAANFTIQDLPEVIRYLHDRNVRGYVAFNTLIFSDELPQAVEFIKACAAAGADALIVQDLGLVRLIHTLAPTLPIHASTQMTLTDARGIAMVRQLGVQRVILARELARDDIGRIVAASPSPVEVFVHGALCVSYSGQCLTSESIGGRSANRGQCAQACRLPYDLIVDGQFRDLGEKAYLLSPQDLAAYDLIGDLVRLGVSSLKIEGRLKSAHYVAATTRTYRAALDAALAGRTFQISENQYRDLAQSFSRGFTHGFLDGANHQKLIHARFPKSRGIRIGVVVGKSPQGLIVELESGKSELADLLKPGDGVVFDEGHPEQDEQGGRIVNVTPIRNPKAGIATALLSFHRADVNLAAVAVGSIVWKTDDPAVRRRLEQSYARDGVSRRVSVHATVRAPVGGALVLEMRDDAGRCASVSWAGPLQPATKFPLTVEALREQLGRLGQTPFELGGVDLLTSDPVMVPRSVLNDLRRQATGELMRHRSIVHDIAVPDALQVLRRQVPRREPGTGNPPAPCLHALVRTMDQLRAALDWIGTDRRPLAGVYCDFEDVRRYGQAVAFARDARIPIALATLRIVKPTEEGLLRQIADCLPDAVLVRNLAAISFYCEHAPDLPLVGDYSLNVANELTAALLAEKGLVRMVPGYDLNWTQLAAMLDRFPPERFEVVVHQHMPMFHMEHCVFAHTLSSGTDHRTCGRPCERHQVDLRDRVGAAHPLIADVGCRNTVYNGAAQSAAQYIPRMRKLGLRHFRVELLRENADETRRLLDRYHRVLVGLEDPGVTTRRLRVLNQLGVTAGTLEHA